MFARRLSVKASHLWHQVLDVLRGLPRQEARAGARKCFRPCLEWLEDRLSPASHNTLLSALPLSFDSGPIVQASGIVATLNPVTAVLEAGRGLLAGSPVKVAVAFTGLAIAMAVLTAFARRGLASAERVG